MSVVLPSRLGERPYAASAVQRHGIASCTANIVIKGEAMITTYYTAIMIVTR
jgi:hypothetical protein